MWILFILAPLVLFGGIYFSAYIGYDHPIIATFSIIATIILPFVLLATAINYYETEYVRDQTVECLAAGGDGLIVRYYAPDICVTSDGSIIFDWKK